MSRWVVVEDNTAGNTVTTAAEAAGDVVSNVTDITNRDILVVAFVGAALEDDAAVFSRAYNGTQFSQLWAANEFARHLATGSP